MSGMEYDAQRRNSKTGSSDGKVSRPDASEQHKSKFDSKTLTVPEQYHTNYMYNKTVSFLQSVEGKTIKITALYIDIVNSSNKVKKLANEETGAYYQTFIEDTSDLIQEHGGYVLKNVGDCVMGFFHASNDHEKQDKAILCGLALRDTIKNSLNAYFMARGLPSIACRITADFGSVAVVRIRSNGDYSAIDVFGSPMNSAAKIQRYAKPDQMVIGSNLFWQLSHDSFEFRLLNQWDLTGKEAYEVYLVDRKNHRKRGDNN